METEIQTAELLCLLSIVIFWVLNAFCFSRTDYDGNFYTQKESVQV